MERGSKGHLDESLNLRSFYLRLLRKIWIIPVAALVGALLAAGLYTLVTVTFGPAKTYKAVARLYISFAYDENKGSLVDYYNAYTWDKELLPTDDILNPIISELENDQIIVVGDDGAASTYGDVKVITRDELLDAITADIPSDVRVMRLTVECQDKEMADLILKASVNSMESFGDNNKAFDSIKLLGIENAKLVTYSDRSVVAAVSGAVVGIVATVLFLMLLAALDDAIYVPEDAEKRYSINVLGCLCDKPVDFFKNELVAATGKAVEGMSEVTVISTDSLSDDKKSLADLASFEEIIAGTEASSNVKYTAMAVPGTVLDNYRKIGTCDGVILCVPYGVRKGAMTEHVIAQLKKHECPIIGILMVRVDSKFIKRYYGLR